MKICFFDTESRSPVDIKRGIYVYAEHPESEIVVGTFNFCDGDKQEEHLWIAPWVAELFYTGKKLEAQLRANAVVEKRWNDWVDAGHIVCAHNARFDRVMFRETFERGGPFKGPKIEQTVCSRAQCENYGLPGGLDKACKGIGFKGKVDGGKRLIKKFCDSTKPFPHEKAVDRSDWDSFIKYAVVDTRACRQLFRATRPWTAIEWHDYHIVEHENDYGMRIDLDFAHAALELSKTERVAMNAELEELTGIDGIKITNSAKKLRWAQWQLAGCPEAYELLKVKKQSTQTAEDGTRRRVTVETLGFSKDVRQAILDWLDTDPDTAGIIDVDSLVDMIDLCNRANDVPSKKYGAMVKMVSADGRLRGQFFCSPTVTGRHASRGVQMDNLIRAGLKNPGEVIDEIVEAYHRGTLKKKVAELETRYFDKKLGRHLSILEILARLLRETIVCDDGNMLAFIDLSAIEARVLAWLAGSEEGLRPYREGACVYSQNAEVLYGRPWKEIKAGKDAGDSESSYQRLIGKVMELSLGYGGGAVALRKMARNMGVKLPLKECERLKKVWRAAKPWAPEFWKELDEAAKYAVRNPGQKVSVRHVTYQMIGRDLFCWLPSGRPIVYPDARIERKWKEQWEEWIQALTFRKVWSGTCVRGELYGGLLAENVTQAVAADILRDAMRRAHGAGLRMIGTTHDEIRIESLESTIDDAFNRLYESLVTVPEWLEGCPIAAEGEKGYFYGK